MQAQRVERVSVAYEHRTHGQGFQRELEQGSEVAWIEAGEIEMLQSTASSKWRKVGNLSERKIELIEERHSPGEICIGHFGERQRERSNAQEASRILRKSLDPRLREI